MRYEQLIAFLAVAKTRHFTQAAQDVGVSQPSLSKQIQSLETALGAKIFTRSRGRIELTDVGQALLTHARRITGAVDAARADVDDVLAVRSGRLRLGATPSLCAWLIAPLLARYLERHPHVNVAIIEDGSESLTDRLSAGEVDLVFTTARPESAEPLIVQPLLTEALVVASAASQPPLSAQEFIGLTQLREQQFILPATGYDLRSLTLAACKQAGFTPRIAVDGGATDAVIGLVEAGLGVALLPAMIAATRPELRSTPLAPPGAARTISLTQRGDITPTNAAAAFAECVDEHLTDLHAWGRLPEGMKAI
ncbi:LysR substrate-binding domain-containing protein [Natronoglycomyces albus]|uniref:LysR family transcriptional regulator n=1 Tax=Natronoglycomyces albus TaxID=2811108 RepID=A0A895XN93_9ACTN|nr:LysR substrate-binding domain-containing protein [Natronoglycomyces albus]QSB06824.1 LysR family transcriptional regulator [Natronoglycomyces albus]